MGNVRKLRRERQKENRGNSWEDAVKAIGATWGLMCALLHENIVELEKRPKTKPSEH